MVPGRLVVCPTPIGNLGDITLRVLDALRSADVIEAEDTRVTRKLLSHFEIHTPMEPYHAKNQEKRTPEVLARIEAGDVVALVSDAGTPGVSDPGAALVSACLESCLQVEVLPGPSAIITALVASGLPTHAFHFEGFLPRKAGERRRAIEALARMEATLVFYESPRRAAGTMAAIAEAMPGRPACMARELTKLFEEVARGTAEELAERIAGRELKGEVVILVGPAPRSGPAIGNEDALRRELLGLMASGMSRKDAVKAVSEQRGLPRNSVYAASLTRENADSSAD